jgi:transaldolase
MGPVIKKLSSERIKLNITAVYTFEQVKKIMRCLNKKTKSIISIFAGRMADKGKDPVPIFKKSISATKKYKNIEILWASTREAYNFLQAKKLKCNIITMPPKVITKIIGFGKSFNSLTLDTVKGFLQDSKKSKFNI